MSSYVQDFYAALDKLEVDAKAVDMTLTSICKATGISRATPDRWRRETPTTVMLLTKMQQVVRDEEARRAGNLPPTSLNGASELNAG